MIRELILFRPFFSLLLLPSFSPFCTYEPTFQIHPTLQRDAKRRLVYAAQQTLDYTHSFYEIKIVTYPHTDSRYLTEDMAPGLPGLVMDTAAAFGFRGSSPVHA